MMNFVSSVIEAFLFPYFLAESYDIDNKKKFIFVSGMLQLLVLCINNYLFTFHYLTAFLIVCINIFFLRKYINTLKIDSIFVPITYYCIIVFSEILSLLVVQISLQFSLLHVLKTTILLVITYFMIKKDIVSKLSLEVKNWKVILVVETVVLIMFIVLGKFVLINPIEYKFLYLIIGGLVILNVSFIMIVYKVNKMNEENIHLITQQQNQQFNDEKVQLIKNIKSEIDAIDHRLFYVIYKIDHLLENNETEKIKQVIDEYKAVVTKHNMIVETGNTVFDCLLSLKINDLIINNIDVKSCIFISLNEKYDNLAFINFLIHLLDCFSNEKNIELFMSEEPGFIMVKILHGNQSNLLKIEEYLKENMIKVDGDYNINKETQEVKVIVKRDS